MAANYPDLYVQVKRLRIHRSCTFKFFDRTTAWHASRAFTMYRLRVFPHRRFYCFIERDGTLLIVRLHDRSK